MPEQKIVLTQGFTPSEIVDAFMDLTTSPYFLVVAGLIAGYIVLNSKAIANLFKRGG